MELDQLGESMTAVASNAVEKVMGALLGLNTFCLLAKIPAGLLSAWAHPLLYRDAGEGALASWFARLLGGMVCWTVIASGVSAYIAFAGFGGSHITPLAFLAMVWAVGLHVADRLAARVRRQEGRYIYSRFMGWPRWTKDVTSPYAHHIGPIILTGLGLVLGVTGWDLLTGVYFLGTAAALEADRWAEVTMERIQARVQEDAKWEQHLRARALEQVNPMQAQKRTGDSMTNAELIRAMRAS